jgi:dTDP-4-dehydrorhamnose reductase
MSAMRLLVTGAAGMLGTEVVAAARGHEVVALGRADLDVTDAAAVRAAVRDARPDAIVNCAAWTDVDGAETAEAAATAVNGEGAGHLAAAAAEAGAHVVHVSTDYVFAGDATEPYREDAPTGPRGAYGRSKLAGEHSVAAAAPHAHAIVRTAWLFGPHGPNFVDTMLRLGSERTELNVVDDQLGCPTYAGHFAHALVQIAAAHTQGVLHVAGGGACTWYELARATFARAGLDVTVHPCTTAEFPRPAPRPAYSVLGSTRRDAPVLPPWQEGLAAHLKARPGNAQGVALGSADPEGGILT